MLRTISRPPDTHVVRAQGRLQVRSGCRSLSMGMALYVSSCMLSGGRVLYGIALYFCAGLCGWQTSPRHSSSGRVEVVPGFRLRAMKPVGPFCGLCYMIELYRFSCRVKALGATHTVYTSISSIPNSVARREMWFGRLFGARKHGSHWAHLYLGGSGEISIRRKITAANYLLFPDGLGALRWNAE